MANNVNNTNHFPGFINTTDTNNVGSNARQAASPTVQHSPNQFNGNSLVNTNHAPALIPAGYQMDVNYLFEAFQALSEQLRQNRELTNGIVRSAEEVMRRSYASGNEPTLDEISGELAASRIRNLEHELAKEKQKTALLRIEQTENSKLISEYEEAVGKMVEQIRNYCTEDKLRYLAQARQYNNLLQKEKDEHLQSRLERDEWHAKALRFSGMIRHAYRLRVDEEYDHVKTISGLQCEVRALRNALGLERETPEEESGWEYLKDAPLSLDGVAET